MINASARTVLTPQKTCCGPGIAYGEDLPVVTVSIEPIQILAAIVRVDFHVHRAVRTAAIRNVFALKSGQDSVELLVGDRKAVVVYIKLIAIHEVDREAIVHVNSREDAE